MPPLNRPTAVELDVALDSPVPLTVNVGLFVAFDVKVSDVLWLPPDVGANVTVMVWALPTTTVKLEGLTLNIGFVLAILLTVSATFPLFVTWKVIWLVLPMFVVPGNAIEEADREIRAEPPVVMLDGLENALVHVAFEALTRQ